MAPNNKALGGGDPQGDASAVNRKGCAPRQILAPQIRRLLGKVPPAGHSHELLTLWLERHSLERRLQLQHHVGGLIDRHPHCPRPISRRVDRYTLRIDSINALLAYLAAGRRAEVAA
jgi:hypothetical protein